MELSTSCTERAQFVNLQIPIKIVQLAFLISSKIGTDWYVSEAEIFHR